jgi:hypothetical protein
MYNDKNTWWFMIYGERRYNVGRVDLPYVDRKNPPKPWYEERKDAGQGLAGYTVHK